METIELIRYRRALKRKNYSANTLKSYLNILNHFRRWIPVALSEVTSKEVGFYVDLNDAKNLVLSNSFMRALARPLGIPAVPL